jgi:hypothetical protein
MGHPYKTARRLINNYVEWAENMKMVELAEGRHLKYAFGIFAFLTSVKVQAISKGY